METLHILITMSWKDLLQKPDETIVTPWLGGRRLFYGSRSWKIKGPLPSEAGMYEWTIDSRTARLKEESDEGVPTEEICGYAVGDLFVSDSQGGNISTPQEMAGRFPRLHLMDHLDHFERVSAHRYWTNGPLFYGGLSFPLGPEDEVREAYLEDKDSLREVKEVTPALDLCFRLACARREEQRRIREEAERARAQEEERQRRAQERAALEEQVRTSLGDGLTRRRLAQVDFETAARSSLSIGGASYVEHRRTGNGEYVVRYTLNGGRYECVCREDLSIVEAGVCLTSETTGERGDSYFTLESLPGVVREAVSEGAVIWRPW